MVGACKGELLVLNSEGDEEKGEKGEERRGTRWVLAPFPRTWWNRTPAGFSHRIWVLFAKL